MSLFAIHPMTAVATRGANGRHSPSHGGLTRDRVRFQRAANERFRDKRDSNPFDGQLQYICVFLDVVSVK